MTVGVAYDLLGCADVARDFPNRNSVLQVRELLAIAKNANMAICPFEVIAIRRQRKAILVAMAPNHNDLAIDARPGCREGPSVHRPVRPDDNSPAIEPRPLPHDAITSRRLDGLKFGRTRRLGRCHGFPNSGNRFVVVSNIAAHRSLSVCRSTERQQRKERKRNRNRDDAPDHIQPPSPKRPVLACSPNEWAMSSAYAAQTVTDVTNLPVAIFVSESISRKEAANQRRPLLMTQQAYGCQ
jgi:hypothetical protein